MRRPHKNFADRANIFFCFSISAAGNIPHRRGVIILRSDVPQETADCLLQNQAKPLEALSSIFIPALCGR